MLANFIIFFLKNLIYERMIKQNETKFVKIKQNIYYNNFI